ncbi:conserved hypothetical protein, partial [Ricinus communis]
VDADGGAAGFAGAIVEAAVMFRTFDDIVHDEPVGQMHLLMRAHAVGRKELVIGAAIDRECPASVIKADHILILDIVDLAGLDPVAHPILPKFMAFDRKLGESA